MHKHRITSSLVRENNMSVSILLITHEEVGNALLHAATTALGELPLPTTVITVNYNADPDSLVPKLQRLANNIERGHGLLILTDLYGSTPSNIAANLKCNKHVRIIAGLNLPMLIRVMNYPSLDLSALAQKALSGGRDGVMNCIENSE